MDRQEALMETILEELTSLRRELKRNESVKREQETETRRASENERTELRGGLCLRAVPWVSMTPFSSTDGNRERAKGEPVRLQKLQIFGQEGICQSVHQVLNLSLNFLNFSNWIVGSMHYGIDNGSKSESPSRRSIEKQAGSVLG
jgi:hypothetical protein